MAESRVVLGYWGIRGLGQPIRYLLEHLQIPYQDKQYTDPTEWFAKDKLALRTDFQSLPYLLDGDKTVTESEAIHLHLILKAKRQDLLGATDDERVHLVQLRGVFHDFRRDLFAVAADKSLTDLQKAFNEKVLPRLTLISKHLGANDFLIGHLSVLDFSFAEMLGAVLLQEGDWLAGLPNLKAYNQRFNNLPGIKEYNASGRAPAPYALAEYINPKWRIAP